MSNLLLTGVGSVGDGSPRDIFGDSLIAWFDATDLSTLWTTTGQSAHPANGGVVARWNDKSKNGNDWRTNTGVYQTTGFNSGPGVHVGFADATWLQMISDASQQTAIIWAMCATVSDGDFGFTMLSMPKSSGNPIWSWFSVDSTHMNFLAGDNFTATMTLGTALTSPSIISWGSNTGAAYQGNVLLGTAGHGALTFSENNGIQTSGAYDHSGNPRMVYQQAILASREPSAAEQLALYTYVKTKAGL